MGKKTAMRTLAILALFVTLSFGITLHENYEYTSEEITLRFFDDTLEESVILTIPKGVSTYKVQSSELIALLKLHEIDATSQSDTITFTKKIIYDKSTILTILEDKFKSYYPYLKINSLEIEPISYIDLDGFELSNVIINKNTIKRSNGTFYVSFSNSSQTKKIHFRYTIDATLKVLVATHNINSNEKLTKNNTTLKEIQFTQIYAKPIFFEDIESVVAKSYIKAKTIITENYTKELPLVFKNSPVIVFYKSGGIEINFEATALEDGYKGEFIKVKKEDGETYRVKITNPRVGIIE